MSTSPVKKTLNTFFEQLLSESRIPFNSILDSILKISCKNHFSAPVAFYAYIPSKAFWPSLCLSVAFSLCLRLARLREYLHPYQNKCDIRAQNRSGIRKHLLQYLWMSKNCLVPFGLTQWRPWQRPAHLAIKPFGIRTAAILVYILSDCIHLSISNPYVTIG